MTTNESTAAVATAPSVLLTDAAVHAVTRLSPAFVRVELASPAFADLGEDGFDTRFKVLLPGPTGALPAIPPMPRTSTSSGWPRRTTYGRRCGPTPSATSSARTTRCGWWSTSSYTRTRVTGSDPRVGGRWLPSPAT